MKKITRNGKIRTMKPQRAPELLTTENFKPILEDIKDFVGSTVKSTVGSAVNGSEAVLRREISELKEDILITQKAVMAVKEDAENFRTELKGDIGNLRTELKDDMNQTEKRLSDKIDPHSSRLDNHEGRILVLEQRSAV